MLYTPTLDAELLRDSLRRVPASVGSALDPAEALASVQRVLRPEDDDDENLWIRCEGLLAAAAWGSWACKTHVLTHVAALAPQAGAVGSGGVA